MEIENDLIKKIDRIKNPIVKILHKIIDEEYVYSVDNIVDALKIQRVYIQEHFIKEMNNLELDKMFKTYCRACLGDLRSYKMLLDSIEGELKYEDFLYLNSDVIDLIVKADIDNYKLSRRILVSRIQLLKLIETKFVQEFETKDGEGKYIQHYYNIDSRHAELMLASGLRDQDYLKQIYGVKTELQVYRRIRKGDYNVLAKYVIMSGSDKKKGMARYLLESDIPYSKVEVARDLFFYFD